MSLKSGRCYYQLYHSYGRSQIIYYVSELELLSRILKSLIKVGYPSRFKSFLSDFLHVDSPCSCDHFEMRLTYVGLLVPKL